MTLIIAEAGVNHNGDMQIAEELINQASKAGADIVKFQTFKAELLSTNYASKANYQKQTTSKLQTQKDMLYELELKDHQHHQLIEICNKYNIEFLSTAFDNSSINFLSKLNLKRFKIPSGEIINFPYLRKIASLKKPIILSTGMATLAEIENALQVLEKFGAQRKNITVLHCTTEYPAPYNEINLKAIKTISEKLNVSVGYSDHTLGIEIPIAAVALGATVIEKHLTLDRNMPGPDHRASLEPTQFKSMVESIRKIEKAIGNGIKIPSKSELENMKVIRKSIVASGNIKKGEIFNNHNLTTKRPGTGLSPMIWEDLIGKKAIRDFAADELISW